MVYKCQDLNVFLIKDTFNIILNLKSEVNLWFKLDINILIIFNDWKNVS